MIRLESVSKQFGDRVLFSDLTMTFEPGKVYALIGSSGSGKTTLMNMMAKLETYDGNIFFREKELRKYKSSEFFRDELGYLFQNFGLLESQSIDENLKLGLIKQKMSKEKRKKLELEALERVGLHYLTLDKRIFELSGGEAQRVALAKLILKNPPFILADEPTASIDPETAKVIMSILLSLKNEDRTIIIATHNPTIWEMTDEVIVVDQL
ncbi:MULTISPECIES: putative bacteriocin export ABC transporter [Streptococcus]|uniref:Bacteriocin export ABC transporter n=1 Tax=Streptococcus ruminantium TaxID=1917441 RepID=A0A2Z5U3S2_9STRE|nr:MULTISPECIES: putative bacteriocin export ABC transporter [Streptococcus]MDQ8758463.1 putative bacteriocin export ABC transporter [Streptococcus ruminantium]MDQ8765758.1 putative bacteriocin export ABC transporter [Streptococcus ruminantium]MDQ8768176.1 putative bacteriocin export ABC transporter [Streptococcus ruminantium]MDQ8773927.1 putative bacteriocin export ABC transporter [Streptococcus ruminantium]MDQ8793690.1 putative bacteriocin export ABC transporter [Streptococcus ruminantium]